MTWRRVIVEVVAKGALTDKKYKMLNLKITK
jgi:hypothetical protein